MTANIFWDRKITREEVQRILKDESDPRFVEYASLVLSREGKPKEVFNEYLDKIVFLRNWQKIKRRMRKDKWNDSRIIFWNEVYSVLLQDVDKNKLKVKEAKVLFEPAKQIGEVIKKSRKCNNWRQEDLAKKAGLSQQLISFIENGYLNVSLATLVKILDALNLRISIINNEVNQTPSVKKDSTSTIVKEVLRWDYDD